MRLLTFLWLKRCSAKVAFPAMVAVVLVFVLGRSGWDWEWQRATDWASGSTILLGPFTAGLVAFDFWRRTPSGLRSVMASAARGRLAVLGPVVSTWIYAVIACAVGVLLAAIRTLAHGADGSPSWWFVVQAPVGLFACAAVGALVGSLLVNAAAAPVAAFAAYLLPVAGAMLGVPDLLIAGGSTGPLIGLEPAPRVMATTIVVDVLIALSCLAVAAGRMTLPSRGAVATAAASLVATVAATSVLVSLDPAQHRFRPAEAKQVCVGESLAVCGPAGGRAIYVLAQRDLARAWSSLQGMGVPPRSGYEYPVGSRRPASGAGLLLVTTEAIKDDRLDPWDVAATISTPSACDAFYADSPPDELLEGQSRLTEWIVARLQAPQDAEDTTLETARDTYTALVTCRPQAVPDWGASP